MKFGQLSGPLLDQGPALLDLVLKIQLLLDIVLLPLLFTELLQSYLVDLPCIEEGLVGLVHSLEVVNRRNHSGAEQQEKQGWPNSLGFHGVYWRPSR